MKMQDQIKRREFSGSSCCQARWVVFEWSEVVTEFVAEEAEFFSSEITLFTRNLIYPK